GTAAADPWPRTLARAAALGAAAVLAPTAGEADPRAYRAFLPTVHVEEYA
ncbi:1-phosphofructokinase, partial [Nocardiopsis dassonvillei]|nr:1-phosphofructokinase [Nocardiopsis dassonvillei]